MRYYTTLDRIEAYLNRSLTANELLLLAEVNDSVVSVIDNYTNRSWGNAEDLGESAGNNPEPTSEARYFSGNGSAVLNIGDFVSISEIKILDSNGNDYATYNVSTNWLTYPRGETVQYQVRLIDSRFPPGYQNIKITGVWGGGQPPADIRRIATALVGMNLLNISSSSTVGGFKSESIEGYSYTLLTGADVKTSGIGGENELFSSLDKWKRFIL